MHDGSGRILVQGLSKNFGPINAVQNLHFAVEPGVVTGFLGPNGSGKTTTLRMILGLIEPSAGTATIGGLPFAQLPNPATVVGAVLDSQGFHPGRTARNHLRSYAAAMNVPDQQADQVLELVGLGSAATRRAAGFSLGMRQRLALATALLGDPQVLVLDEPSNGLDPEGIAWLRGFLKSFAATGRTVLVSSHLLREMEHTVDHVVIVSRGQCVYNGNLEHLRSAQRSRVLVQAADPNTLVTALQQSGLAVEHLPDGRLAVLDSDSRTVADLALQAGVALYGMQDERVDLEQLFFQLTHGQYTGGAPHAGSAWAGGPAQWGPQSAGFAPSPYQQVGYQQPEYQQPGYQPPPGGPPQQDHQQRGGSGGFGGGF
ncbi:ATP-binding cassette domain-containing protein [Haloactinomyces albus]|uniref:ABC-2 type transport system ATP-binding protein n=1 Tax=Haloactinomyces albus TaxID=1352928 RepID=A0AAE3ZC98_9ACTN|nr:ATP-binding cassette domain-containing protein [Haloactinomyces albus]MDR7301205.1 ABC-2 type transport system ATP-binding protein [Haloactinomyces albus]